MGRYVVGISGASGIVLAFRMVTVLVELGHQVELVMSKHALYTATLEMGKEYSTLSKCLATLPKETQKNIRMHPIQDMGCSIASGTYPTDGMFIIPCSMATVAALAVGLGDNVLRRAADVTLKEKRRLVLVPREAPLSEIHLENMLKLSRLGAMIVPPVPAWYTKPTSLLDVENFIVGKTLDAMGIMSHALYPRWS